MRSALWTIKKPKEPFSLAVVLIGVENPSP